MRSHWVVFSFGIALSLPSVWAVSTGSNPSGLAGAPGQSTCAACHGSGSVSTGPGRVRIEAVSATGYAPGTALRLRVTIEDPDARRWGFQLTARRASANTQPMGTFTNVAGQGTSIPAQPTIGHSAAGTRPGTANSASWEVDWNPPAANEGPVIFYAAGNAANNDNNSDPGDRVYTTSLQVEPAGATDVTGNTVLPQYVFGAGFISTLSFANTRDAAATVRVNFLNDSGAPLNVNGQSAHTLNLAGKASASIRADDSGPTTQGWALIDLPDGVTGNAVFRQRVSGRPDQEVAVLLSRANATEARFIYDQTGSLNTGMAIVNTSSAAAQVTIRFRDESGAAAATVTRSVPARSKVAISVRDDAAFAGALNKKGLAEVEVSGATVAVLALRFDDAGALTSVPNAQ